MSDRILGELITRIRRPIAVEPGKTYAEVGVRSYGKGIFHKPPVTGADLGAKKVFEIKPGDLVFNIVFAWEGAVAFAGEEEEGRCGSHRFPTYRPVPGECLAEYINLFFQTQMGRDLLLLSSPGSAGRNRTLNQEMLLGCIIPCPPVEDQRRVVDLIRTVDNAVGASRKVQEAALMTVQVLGGGGTCRS